MLTPQPGPVAPGASFQVSVVLNGGTNVAAVPLQIFLRSGQAFAGQPRQRQLLSSDGQAVALVHRDDGPGRLTLLPRVLRERQA